MAHETRPTAPKPTTKNTTGNSAPKPAVKEETQSAAPKSTAKEAPDTESKHTAKEDKAAAKLWEAIQVVKSSSTVVVNFDSRKWESLSEDEKEVVYAINAKL